MTLALGAIKAVTIVIMLTGAFNTTPTDATATGVRIVVITTDLTTVLT